MRISDWSSDVGSSDLSTSPPASARIIGSIAVMRRLRSNPSGASEWRLQANSPVVSRAPDRQGVGKGKGGAVRVDLGGGRSHKKKMKNTIKSIYETQAATESCLYMQA